MNSILDVQLGLPPGLWLPTADESSEQYRTDVFNRSDHDYETVVDFGAFATALMYLDANTAESEQVSCMPRQRDLRELYYAGYGISPSRMYKRYGGEAKLQHALGFYPDGYVPSQEELLKRFAWMGTFVMPRLAEFQEQIVPISEVLKWGVNRNLLPTDNIVRQVLGGHTVLAQRALGIEKPYAKRQYTFLDVYRFGAKVIKENNGPVGQTELNNRYANEFVGAPHSVVRSFFDNLGNFWEAYGYYPDSKYLERDDFINIGVKYAIANGGAIVTRTHVDALSAQRRFPSSFPIYRHFGNFANYRSEVESHYEAFLTDAKTLIAGGVSEEVMLLVGRNYKNDNNFSPALHAQVRALIKLSGDSDAVRYIRSIILHGFCLEDAETYAFQMQDFKQFLFNIGIRSKKAKAFVFGLIPRVNSSEALASN